MGSPRGRINGRGRAERQGLGEGVGARAGAERDVQRFRLCRSSFPVSFPFLPNRTLPVPGKRSRQVLPLRNVGYPGSTRGSDEAHQSSPSQLIDPPPSQIEVQEATRYITLHHIKSYHQEHPWRPRPQGPHPCCILRGLLISLERPSRREASSPTAASLLRCRGAGTGEVGESVASWPKGWCQHASLA